MIDFDGGLRPYSTTVTVINVAPTGTLANPTINEGQTAAIGLQNVADVSPLDVAAGLRYAYDLDGDGAYELGSTIYATAVTQTTANVPAALAANGPASRTIRIAVVDRNGGVTAYTSTLSVVNVAPTGTLSNSGPVVEGGAATVSFADLLDASASDLAAGIRYAYDLDDNGTYEIGGTTYATASTQASAAVPAAVTDNGPASLLVRAAVIDRDNGLRTIATRLIVTNAQPTGRLEDRTVAEGSTPTAGLVDVTDISAGDVAAGLRYAYDLDGDGTYELGTLLYAGALAQASAPFPAAVTQDGPAARDFNVAVADRDNGSTAYRARLTVTNVAPSATLADLTVDEGAAAELAFGSPSDPSPLDEAAGFTYEWDGRAGTQTLAVPAADGPSTRTVRGAISDRDGGRREYEATVTVRNVAPTVTLAGPEAVGVAGTVTLTVDVEDPGDDAVTSTLDWGDGTTETLTGTGERTATHTYAAPGSYGVAVVADDDDGARSERASHTVAVAAAPAATTPPAAAPGPAQKALKITGLKVTPRCLRASKVRAVISRTMSARFTLSAPADVRFELKRLQGKRGAGKCPPPRGRVQPRGGKRTAGVYSPFTSRAVRARAGANRIVLTTSGRGGKTLRPGTYLLTVTAGGVVARTKLWVLRP